MQTPKRRYTYEEAVVITIDQWPLPSNAQTKHYSRPGHVSFDSHKLVTLAVESFGGLGVKGSTSSTSWQLASRRRGAEGG